MDKIKGSHYFLIFLGAAIALNIFTNIASAFGIIPTPGPLITAIIWSSLTATMVALIIAYMQGVFVKESDHAKKKTAGLSNAFYGFFITATVLMVVNLFGEKQFMNTCYAILTISGIAFVVNLLLPEVFLYLNRLGDSHKDDLDKKITKKKAKVTADPDEKKDEEAPKTNWVKIALIIIGIAILFRLLSGNNNQQATTTVQPNTEAVDPDVIRAQARAKANGDWNEPSANQGQDRIVNGTPASSEEEAMINNNGVR